MAERRAAAAENAVIGRHARRLWAIPGTMLGVNSRPATARHRLFLGWNYWWQTHLLDCLVDAEIRDPRADRRRRMTRLIRGIRLANGGRWINSYYDDMAWLALAIERADRCLGGADHSRPLGTLTAEILAAWSDAEGGGIPWRHGDVFKNAPANGPAAILLARTGQLDRAVATADWMDARLRDPASGLIWDGLRPGDGGTTSYERTIYTYCQGVVLGAECELARRIPAAHPDSADRVHRLVAAIGSELATDGVLTGHHGGDSGLFTGILARYLALVATALPGNTPADDEARSAAGTLLTASAEAAWAHAGVDRGLPVFGHDWTRPAGSPRGRGGPERDLSVQLSGWMLLEAASAVTAGRPGDDIG